MMTWRLKKDASRNKHGFSWFQTSLQGETSSDVNKIPEKMVGWSGVSISRGEILSPLFSPNFAGCLPATSFSHALEATSTQHSLFDLAPPPLHFADPPFAHANRLAPSNGRCCSVSPINIPRTVNGHTKHRKLSRAWVSRP